MPVVSVLSGEPEYLNRWAPTRPRDGSSPATLVCHRHAREQELRRGLPQRYNETPKVGSVVGYASLMSIAQGLKAAGAVDTEKLVDAFAGLKVGTPYGQIQYRKIDHQSTMGVYVDATAVEDGKGIMKDFAYMDGARLQPPDEQGARCVRPSDERFRAAVAVAQRPGGRQRAVPGGRGPVADLRRHARGQLLRTARFTCWASTWPGPSPAILRRRRYWAGLLLAALATGLIGAAAERLVLSRSSARPSCSSCWPPSRCCSSSATPRWPCGAGSTSPPAPSRGRGRDPGPPLPAIRPAAHRRRPDRAGPAVAAADAHALGPAAARRLEKRSMLAALGVNQAWLFTSASRWARLPGRPGGALAAPRTPATLGWTWKSSPAPSWWWAARSIPPAPSWPRC